MSLVKRSILAAGSCTVACLLILLLDTAAEDLPGGRDPTHYQTAWTLGAAGVSGATADLRLKATLGQTGPVGLGTVGSEILHGGFWWSTYFSGIPVAVPDLPPSVTRLHPAAPNPFNPATTIRCSIADPGRMSLVIYDVRGRIVRRLANEIVPAGIHEFNWNGRNDHGRAVASGPYFCRMEAVDHVGVVKMLLVK
jgi:hypothetical protein